jgi:hypothetical protein
LLFSYKTDAHSVAVDVLGNHYLIGNTRIEMFDDNGKKKYEYNSSISDRIYSVDISRALRPLVYFKEQGRVDYLDNTLSLQNNSIDLFSLPFDRIGAVAASVDNHIWIYDEARNEVFRLDESLNVISSSGNLGNWLPMGMEEVIMHEDRDRLYLADAETGIVMFDLYGNFVAQLITKPIDDFFLGDGGIYFLSDKGWFFYHHLTKNETAVIFEPTFAPCRVAGGRLYVLNNNYLQVFRFVRE